VLRRRTTASCFVYGEPGPQRRVRVYRSGR
jgi:hypothetical protein